MYVSFPVYSPCQRQSEVPLPIGVHEYHYNCYVCQIASVKCWEFGLHLTNFDMQPVNPP